MDLTRDQMLAGIYARDRACDGRYLTGVLTTGIYCLPSCPARKPKPENVRFFATERDARKAGLRACLRCRPDRFGLGRDPDLDALDALDAEVARDPGAFPGVADLAAASGLGATKLHALFRTHRGTTPAAFLNRARVAEACRRLDAGDGSALIEVAAAVGYASLSAFHANFRRLAGRTPGEYRRGGGRAGSVARAASVDISGRRP